MPKGLQIEELRPGDGRVAERGKTVTVRYDGYLSKGDKFQEGFTCTFRLGAREVIAGLEYGVQGMRVGGQRKVRFGPHLGYRATGVGGIIPPNARLTLIVELLYVEEEA